MPLVKQRLMVPSRRASTPPAPEKFRQTTLHYFRDVVRVVDGVKAQKVHATHTDEKDKGEGEGEDEGEDDFAPSGWFASVSDDVIALIIDHILRLPDANGVPYLRAAQKSCTAVVNFALSCNRVASVLRTNAVRQHAELLARSSTKILPSRTDVEHPFTEQVRTELLSCDQLKMLRSALKSMACHCTNPACCTNFQKAFNKDLSRGMVFTQPSSPRLVPTKPRPAFRLIAALQSCSMLAATPNGEVAFCYMRRRVSRIAVHGADRSRRYQDSLVRVEKVTGTDGVAYMRTTHTLDIDFDTMSTPLTMRASHDGTAMAFVCSLHGAEAGPFDDSAVSVLRYWNTKTGVVEDLKIVEHRCQSVQDAWFTPTDSTGASTLVVAQSDGFVHLSGHVLEWGCPYRFSTYMRDDEGALEHYESTSVHAGRLMTACSPTHAGTRVLVLTWYGGYANPYGRYRRVVHDIDIDSTIEIAEGFSQNGPIAASISRTGDCIVSLYKHYSSILLEVMVLNGQRTYTPVQKVDVSTFLALVPRTEPPTISTDLVMQTHDLVFSPCGRFVAIVDRRPRFGEMAHHYGVVTVDLALRMETARCLKPRGLFATDDQAPRDFQWTDVGIWLLPPGTDDGGTLGARGGALLLHAPTTVSLC